MKSEVRDLPLTRRRWLQRSAGQVIRATAVAALGASVLAVVPAVSAQTPATPSPALDHSYAAWDALLKKHVKWLPEWWL